MEILGTVSSHVTMKRVPLWNRSDMLIYGSVMPKWRFSVILAVSHPTSCNLTRRNEYNMPKMYR